MKVIASSLGVFLLLLGTPEPLPAHHPSEDRLVFRVVSWNVSGDSFVTHEESFRAVMRHTRPDVLVLDEVLPSIGVAQLQDLLAGTDPADERPWNVDFGASGGRQRGVIASRWPIEPAFAFSGIVPYPEGPRQRIAAQMSEQDHQWIRYSMEGGIPVNGAVVVTAGQRLLVVAVDLQCCGGGSDDWQEDRRRVEAREIRRLVNLELTEREVDGTVLAGDLNPVGTSLPVKLLEGPCKEPAFQLATAGIFHLDGVTDWTWDGRGTPFPSGILDYQLYSRRTLKTGEAYVFDTEDLDAGTLEALGLQAGTSALISRHRPLVVEYSWR